jgi:GNAT superfamily N-acetyltransferase
MKPRVIYHEMHKVYGTWLSREVLFVFAELAKTGVVDGDCCHCYSSTRAFYATVRGKLVGFLTYAIHEDDRMYKTGLAYVAPGYRGRGIYQNLYARMKARAKARRPIPFIIQGVVNAPNIRLMRPIMRASGRKLARYVFEE